MTIEEQATEVPLFDPPERAPRTFRTPQDITDARVDHKLRRQADAQATAR